MSLPSKSTWFAAAKRWDARLLAAWLAQAPQWAQAVDGKGRTALQVACGVSPQNAHSADTYGLETVATLLAAGAPLEAQAPMGECNGDFRATALWFAVSRGENLPLVKLLLSHGANASYSLWAAVWRDDEAMCRALLQARPLLNLREHGETPVFYAARLGRLKTLELLLDAGADVSVADFKGRDAVDIAVARRLPQALIYRMQQLRQPRLA
ncbi:ankyrin repeat domain-containing protein [Comamonas sp. B21-038]|uniref:ankyrin repeat domain-containing protein n=1 Tax=Comamonas sp. B21-038 TaxID=2918299 RepID=UPI001EFA8589|nr:ankyrin repeat domain-containing protein [Comamonas sp. B21-038]ULR88365.1 ankyrin repeat domain-containing protein [Comamonas sp. B21-038]